MKRKNKLQLQLERRKKAKVAHAFDVSSPASNPAPAVDSQEAPLDDVLVDGLPAGFFDSNPAPVAPAVSSPAAPQKKTRGATPNTETGENKASEDEEEEEEVPSDWEGDPDEYFAQLETQQAAVVEKSSRTSVVPVPTPVVDTAAELAQFDAMIAQTATERTLERKQGGKAVASLVKQSERWQDLQRQDRLTALKARASALKLQETPSTPLVTADASSGDSDSSGNESSDFEEQVFDWRGMTLTTLR
jgi:hypothetical protein